MINEAEVQAYLEHIENSGGIVLGLESIRELMAELDNVQQKLQFIHVAGTNGKGSVCAMLSSILIEAGIRVGTYTSPAVFDRREQYQVDGKRISWEEFAEVIAQVKTACERMKAKGKMQPTVFEVETAAAFLYFYHKKCEVVVLETGMGGETDATNVITKPLVSVLTSISIDHMRFLGNSLRDIAKVKAGIIKEGCPVVATKQEPQVCQVIEEACCRKGVALVYGDERQAEHVRYDTGIGMLHFCYPGLGELALSMSGAYQVQNAACAIETAKVLQTMGFPITDQQLRTGLSNARWQGRFSTVFKEPLFVMDGAHNVGAAKKLQETLKRGFTNRKIIYIIGVLADKEHEQMLQIMLPLAWKVYTVTPFHKRAMDGQALAKEASKYHQKVRYCPNMEEAVSSALKSAEKEQMSMILAFGSLSYLKELRETLKEK